MASFARALSGAPLHVHLSVWMLVGGGAVSATVLCRMSSRAALRSFRLETTLEHLASTDPLTSALNRHAFDRGARVELSRASRHAVPVGLLILDIDHFKRVNDTFGHPAGDAAIRGLLRGSDPFARLGVASRQVNTPTGTFGFTISVGVTAAAGGGPVTLESLVQDADRALYAAKRGGRNRVESGPLRRVA